MSILAHGAAVAGPTMSTRVARAQKYLYSVITSQIRIERPRRTLGCNYSSKTTRFRRTVPRNHECATPASVNPSRSTLNPPMNTDVFATVAAVNPGDGFIANAFTVSIAVDGSKAATKTREGARG